MVLLRAWAFQMTFMDKNFEKGIINAQYVRSYHHYRQKPDPINRTASIDFVDNQL